MGAYNTRHEKRAMMERVWEDIGVCVVYSHDDDTFEVWQRGENDWDCVGEWLSSDAAMDHAERLQAKGETVC